MLQAQMESRVNELDSQIQSQVSVQRRLERKRDTDVEEFMGKVNELKNKMRLFENEFNKKYEK